MPNNGFDTKLVKDLAKILRDQELSEIEIDHEGTKIRVSRTLSAAPQNFVAMPPPAFAPHAPVSVAAPIEAKAETSDKVAAQPKGGSSANNVSSPMVGTAYLAAEPGAKPFVNVGDTVKEGQQLFIIEAMKTLNPVNSPRSGVVTAIFVGDAQPVEFGEPLCSIE